MRRYFYFSGKAAIALLLLSLLTLSTGCAKDKFVPEPIKPVILNDTLEHPWGMAFIGSNQVLVTERPGRMRLATIRGARADISAPLANVPKVVERGQGGLLDVVADSQFAINRRIYFCYAEADRTDSKLNSTALARAKLSGDLRSLEDVKVIFQQQPKVDSSLHFGCRIVEMPDGYLMMTLGDRYERKDEAQTLHTHHGKVIRIDKDGAPPPSNPYIDRKDAKTEIWSIGHRNPQGATLGLDGRLWTHEHGPQGGDEINRPDAGKNYGWPAITYGENYGGGKIGEGITTKAGMEQPLHNWTPSIAPSGMTFLSSDRYGANWKGNLFIGSLKFRYLNRIELKDSKVVAEHKLLRDIDARVRDVRQGPDGLLYVLTDEEKGKLIRIDPKQ
jgi:aldose sugar dehydrogenase